MSTRLAGIVWALCLALCVAIIGLTPGADLTTAALAGIALAQWAMRGEATRTARAVAGLTLGILLPGFFSYIIPETLVSTRQWLAGAQALAPGSALTHWRPPLLATLALMLLAIILLLRQRAYLGAPVLLSGAAMLTAAQLLTALLPTSRTPLLVPHLDGFALLALGALVLAQLLLVRPWWQSKTRLKRSLLPASTLILATLALWQYQHRHNDTALYNATQQDGARLTARLSDNIQDHLEAMRRFAHAWQLLTTPPTEQQWRSQAARLHDKDFLYLLNIAFVRPDSLIDYVYPRNPLNRDVQGQRLFEVQTQSTHALDLALAGKRQTSTDIIELLQGGPGIIYYLPVYNASQTPVGAAAMAISLPLLADTLFNALDPDTALLSWQTHGRVLASFGNPRRQGPWAHQYRLDLSGQTLDVVQRPRRDYLLARLSRLPALSLTIGLMLAYLLYMVLYTFKRLDEQNIAFRRSNARLQEEINERQRLQEEVEWLARHDELTGIANRRYFMELVEEQRNTHPLSLVLCDIDYFKRVNDQLGHLVGDHYLEVIAGIGQAVMAEHGGFFARYGGEEFIGCLPGADQQHARHVAETLRQRVYQRALLHADGHNVSLSAGLVTHTTGTPNMPRLMQAADDALYRAKQRGRNRIENADNASVSDA